MTKKTKFQIKSIWGSVLFESETAATVKEAAVEANLREADLYGANLYGADLRRADLRGADLREADLRGADLRGANLREANLREADLRGADLREANLYEANLREADLYEANLYGANLYGANLRGADLEKLPKDFINQCSRDILFILACLKNEVPGLRKALIEGRVDGSQYTGDCACLIGTLAKLDGGVDKICETIPFYEKGIHNMGETFFLSIRKGDTPDKNSFAKHAVMLCDMVVPPVKIGKAKIVKEKK